MRSAVQLLSFCVVVAIVLFAGGGCANIIPPGGGPRDSIPPQLLSATPPDSSRNVSPQRITLTFNEYISQLQNTENIIISPTLNNIPTIESKLRTVTVRFRDTLEPNTTYSINFADAIRDVNEGNILEDFTFVFSTGSTIDDNTLTGKVLLAETGKVDSTLIVVLHRNLSDSAVIKNRPAYYTRLNGEGIFRFNNLPKGQFAVYALPNDFLRRYDDSTKLFAFLNSPVFISDSTPGVLLYAYQQDKRRAPTTPAQSTGTKSQDKRLRYSTSEAGPKDIFKPLQLEFVRKLKTFDSTKFILTDTNYNRLTNTSVRLDSTATKVIIQHQWRLNTAYKLLITQDAVTDNDNITLTKADTLSFTTSRSEDYGQVRVRFSNLDLSKNPVLQVVQGETIVASIPMTGREWRASLFKPGEYDLRILYDTNKNSVWDPGNFSLKKQPEVVQSISRKLSIKANWENEVDINL